MLAKEVHYARTTSFHRNRSGCPVRGRRKERGSDHARGSLCRAKYHTERSSDADRLCESSSRTEDARHDVRTRLMGRTDQRGRPVGGLFYVGTEVQQLQRLLASTPATILLCFRHWHSVLRMRCKFELLSIFEISPCVATGSRALARTRGRATRSPRSARNLPTRRKRWKRHSVYRKNGADRCAAGRFRIWNRRRQNFSGNSDSPGAHRPGSHARTANRANESAVRRAAPWSPPSSIR